MRQLSKEQVAIAVVMGRAVSLLKKLTNAVAVAPMPSWILPSNAEAVPAFLVNGARESAEVLGNIKPCQLRKMKNKPIVPNTLYKCMAVPATNTMPVND